MTQSERNVHFCFACFQMEQLKIHTRKKNQLNCSVLSNYLQVSSSIEKKNSQQTRKEKSNSRETERKKTNTLSYNQNILSIILEFLSKIKYQKF